MARQLSGEATPEELEELHSFLKSNPQAQYFFEVFSDYWQIEPRTAEDDIQEEIHFQQIIAIAEKASPEDTEAPEVRVRRLTPLHKLAMAAVFIGLVAASWLLFFNRPLTAPSANVALNEVVARSGARSFLLLPDGSKVWLNSESRIEYKGNFNDTIREVVLEGEAYFDVVKDKKRPFIVHTSDIDIRVLGTAFNVKCYPREASIEATLIHGMIEVTNKTEPTSPKVILRPHEKLVFHKDGRPVSDLAQKGHQNISSHKPFSITSLPRNIPDSSVVETAWVYDKLVFDGETFREIASKMERWYNVKICLRNEKLASLPLHVEFTNETVEEALEALKLIEPFKYKINGNEIEILKK